MSSHTLALIALICFTVAVVACFIPKQDRVWPWVLWGVFFVSGWICLITSWSI